MEIINSSAACYVRALRAARSSLQSPGRVAHPAPSEGLPASPWLQSHLLYGSQGSSLHVPDAPSTRPAALGLGSARSIRQTLSHFGAHAVACGKRSEVGKSLAGQGCSPSGVQSAQSPTSPPWGYCE